jgi:hypothetical protein
VATGTETVAPPQVTSETEETDGTDGDETKADPETEVSV